MISQYLNIFEVFLHEQNPILIGIYLILAKILGAVVFFPGTPLTLLSGAYLGLFWGSVVAIIGNTLGATAAFLLARFVAKDFVQNRILKKYPKINEYEDRLFTNGFKTVLFFRLVPLFPFNALNFILGVTELKFKDYFFGTLIGIIPGTIAFVYFGESLKMLSATNIIISLSCILLLIIIPKILKIK